VHFGANQRKAVNLTNVGFEKLNAGKWTRGSETGTQTNESKRLLRPCQNDRNVLELKRSETNMSFVRLARIVTFVSPLSVPM
jgi:hypothetical protein